MRKGNAREGGASPTRQAERKGRKMRRASNYRLVYKKAGRLLLLLKGSYCISRIAKEKERKMKTDSVREERKKKTYNLSSEAAARVDFIKKKRNSLPLRKEEKGKGEKG